MNKRKKIARKHFFPGQEDPIPKRPVARFRMYPVEAVICCHTGEDGKRVYAVSFHRVYRDGKGRSKTSRSLFAADLPQLRDLAFLAHRKLIELYAADEKNNNPTA